MYIPKGEKVLPKMKYIQMAVTLNHVLVEYHTKPKGIIYHLITERYYLFVR